MQLYRMVVFNFRLDSNPNVELGHRILYELVHYCFMFGTLDLGSQWLLDLGLGYSLFVGSVLHLGSLLQLLFFFLDIALETRARPVY